MSDENLHNDILEWIDYIIEWWNNGDSIRVFIIRYWMILRACLNLFEITYWPHKFTRSLQFRM